MRPSELDDSVLNEMLVGVATSVEEEKDDGNTGKMSTAGVVIVESQGKWRWGSWNCTHSIQ